MYLDNFNTSGLRNLSDIKIVLSSELNIIEGVNAAGKSSLLEGIAFLVSGRSFRTSKNSQIIAHDQNKIHLFGQFNEGTKIGVSFERKKGTRRIKLNGVKIDALSKIASIFPVQVLSPESYHLIDSGPSQRRRYLDWLLFHVEHSYKADWLSFNKVLKQRNSYLSSLKGNLAKLDMLQLNVWNDKFLNIAEVISEQRCRLVESLSLELSIVLRTINIELSEGLSIEYSSGSGSIGLSEKLSSSIEYDVRRGVTSFGPHKADMKIHTNGREVKDVLSRGQKKMLINALYLAQTSLLKRLSNKDSLFIIDDFSSELDNVNQLQLVLALKKHQNVQVLISCLDSKVLKPLIKEYNNVTMFHVKHGEISEVTLPC